MAFITLIAFSGWGCDQKWEQYPLIADWHIAFPETPHSTEFGWPAGDEVIKLRGWMLLSDDDPLELILDNALLAAGAGTLPRRARPDDVARSVEGFAAEWARAIESEVVDQRRLRTEPHHVETLTTFTGGRVLRIRALSQPDTSIAFAAAFYGPYRPLSRTSAERFLSSLVRQSDSRPRRR